MTGCDTNKDLAQLTQWTHHLDSCQTPQQADSVSHVGRLHSKREFAQTARGLGGGGTPSLLQNADVVCGRLVTSKIESSLNTVQYPPDGLDTPILETGKNDRSSSNYPPSSLSGMTGEGPPSLFGKVSDRLFSSPGGGRHDKSFKERHFSAEKAPTASRSGCGLGGSPEGLAQAKQGDRVPWPDQLFSFVQGTRTKPRREWGDGQQCEKKVLPFVHHPPEMRTV